jgi:hypothetical protein
MKGGGGIVAVSAVVARGAGPKFDDSKKDLGSSFTIFALGCHVFGVPQRWLCSVYSTPVLEERGTDK